MAEQQFRFPAVELAAPDDGIGLDGAASRREDQEHRDVGGRIGEDTRGVADDDPTRGGGGDVDVVVADGIVRDTQQASIVQQFGVESITQLGDDHRDVAARAERVEFVVGGW